MTTDIPARSTSVNLDFHHFCGKLHTIILMVWLKALCVNFRSCCVICEKKEEKLLLGRNTDKETDKQTNKQTNKQTIKQIFDLLS